MKKWFYHLLIFLSLNQFVSAQPSIQSFSPSSGPVGSTVIITGSKFNPTPSENIVYFGAAKTTVTAASANSISVIVPAGATYQPITVTSNGLTAYSLKPFDITFAGGEFGYTAFSSFLDTTDLHPYGMAIADFDGDGLSDLATANNYLNAGTTSSLSILRNTSARGFISFAPKQDLQTGGSSYAIATGDLDGDGKPDMISSSVINKTISLFRNTSNPGAISFAPKIDYPVGDDPFGIVVGDLDGDGKPDIIVANYLSNTLSVFQNTSSIGNISFVAKTTITSGLTPQNLALGDIDGDGKMDLVVINFLANSFSVFRNTSTLGNFSFAPKIDITTGTDNPFGVSLGDLDGDGKPDVVITNNNYTSTASAAVSMSMFRNTSSAGNVSFAPSVDAPIFGPPTGNALNPAIEDMTGDGIPEVLVPFSSGEMLAYHNESSPGELNFPDLYKFQAQSPFALVIGDLDGDGMPDMVASNSTINVVSVFKNVMKAPHPNLLTPTAGNTGTVVTITGVNFTGATAVSFGGTPASSFSITNDTKISAVVGAGASGDVSVTSPYGTLSVSGFVFDGPPTVTSFSPISADSGLTVSISGTNFNGVTAVSFGGTPALSFTVISSSLIEAVVGIGTSGAVSVSTGFGIGTLPGFIDAPPVITSFSPTSAAMGDSVTITGTNFSGVQSVYFGGAAAATFTIVSPTELIAVLPGGASGNITLQTVRSVSVPGFTFISPPPPVISAVSPDSAPIGSVITVTGNNFNPIAANNIASFGAVTGSIISATATSLTVSVPNGSTFQPLSILNSSNGLVGYSTKSFSNTLPIVESVDSSLFDSSVQITGQISTTGVCDIDGDGKADLIGESISYATGPGQLSITVMRNIGSPGVIAFQNGLQFPLANNPDDLGGNFQIADLDGDGKKDIVAMNAASECCSIVSVLQNTSIPGIISFAPELTLPVLGTANVSTADLNGDGRTDIIASGGDNDSYIDIYLNASTINHLEFGTMTKYYIPGDLLGFADINGDGKPDILLSDGLTNGPDNFAVSVMLNTGVGDSIAFAAPVIIYSTVYDHFLTGAVIGDIDGDGKPDLFIVNSANAQGSFAVLKNNSSKTSISFSYTNYEVDGKPYTPVLADVNGDGKPDLITVEGPGDSSRISVYENLSSAGNISLGPKKNYSVLASWGALSAGDFDGDGKTDLVDIGFESNVLDFLLNTGLESPMISYSGLSTICSGDTVVLNSSIAANNQWYRNGTLMSGDTAANLLVTTSGSYTVRAMIDGTQLPPSPGISIKVNPTPAMPIITVDAGNHLISSDTSGNQWYIDTTTTISGATSQVFMPATSGLYAVKATAVGCPSSFSEVYNFKASAAGGATVVVTPNPAKNDITISYTLSVNEVVFVEIVDMNGKKVLTKANVQDGDILYIGNLSPGLYTLKLYSYDGKIDVNVKIVKL